MKRLLALLFLFTSLVSTLDTAEVYGEAYLYPAYRYPHGMVPVSMNGRGAIPIASGSLWNIGVGNPATLHTFQQPAVSIIGRSSPEFDLQDGNTASGKWRSGITPQSVAIVYPYWAAVLAGSVHERYSLQSYASSPEYVIRMHGGQTWQYTVSLAKAYNNVFTNRDTIAFGGQFEFYDYMITKRYVDKTHRWTIYNHTWQLGIQYSFSGITGRLYQVGVTYAPTVFVQSNKYIGEDFFAIWGSLPGVVATGGMITYPGGVTLGLAAKYHWWRAEERPPDWGGNTVHLLGTIGFPLQMIGRGMVGIKFWNPRPLTSEREQWVEESKTLSLFGGVEWQNEHWAAECLVEERHYIVGLMQQYFLVKMGVGYKL